MEAVGEKGEEEADEEEEGDEVWELSPLAQKTPDADERVVH